jgi:two-component system response regulator (stage 0 sporulation protein F)
MNRILVIDDDPSIRLLYSDELGEEGYDVIEEGDGMKALQVIRQERPDLVVLDVRLGRLSGIEVLKDIRCALPEVPVILCTAYPLVRQDQESIAADAYATKNSDLGELKSKIRRILQGGAETAANRVPLQLGC